MNGRRYSQLGLHGSLEDAAGIFSSGQRLLSSNRPALNKASQSRIAIHFLVPVDFSEISMQGVRYALELANSQNAEVILLHVIDVKFNWPPTGPVNVTKLRQDMRAEAETKMEALVKGRELTGVAVQPVITEGVPWEEIAAQAKDSGVTLIVMGRGTKKTFWHLFRRHTARRVVECAPCPVLAIPCGPGTQTCTTGKNL